MSVEQKKSHSVSIEFVEKVSGTMWCSRGQRKEHKTRLKFVSDGAVKFETLRESSIIIKKETEFQHRKRQMETKAAAFGRRRDKGAPPGHDVLWFGYGLDEKLKTLFMYLLTYIVRYGTTKTEQSPELTHVKWTATLSAFDSTQRNPPVISHIYKR